MANRARDPEWRRARVAARPTAPSPPGRGRAGWDWSGSRIASGRVDAPASHWTVPDIVLALLLLVFLMGGCTGRMSAPDEDVRYQVIETPAKTKTVKVQQDFPPACDVEPNTDVTNALAFLLLRAKNVKTNLDTIDAAQVDRYVADDVARRSLDSLLADYDREYAHLVHTAMPEWEEHLYACRKAFE